LIAGEDPKRIVQFLNYASTFPDFPKNFTPPWLTDPNYVAPANYARLESFTYVMAVLSTVVVVARLYIRKRIKGMVFGWDDWLAIPGLILALGLFAVVILLIRIGGAGRHVYDVSFQRIEKTQQLEFAGLMIYYLAIFVIRMSITAFLYRLMGATSRFKRMLLHGTVVLLVLELLVQVFAYVFAYKPISANWDMNTRLDGYTTHLNITLEIFILSILYLLTDIWLLILPVHTIWKLQLSLQTRIGVTWIFVFGGVACAGAIVKACYIYPTLYSFDPLWRGIPFVAGAVIEVSFGVISSSMPALNHLIVSGRFTRWVASRVSPSGSHDSNSRSFKESFRDYTGGSGGSSRNNRRADTIDLCEDEYSLDTPYEAKYEFKHTRFRPSL